MGMVIAGDCANAAVVQAHTNAAAPIDSIKRMNRDELPSLPSMRNPLDTSSVLRSA
jgi:hypothetical protein